MNKISTPKYLSGFVYMWFYICLILRTDKGKVVWKTKIREHIQNHIYLELSQCEDLIKIYQCVLLIKLKYYIKC